MSINSYLTTTSSNLTIADNEYNRIAEHLKSLESKLQSYFLSGSIIEHFPFGSFTRRTLMPRIVDSRSDVDYMVVFSSTNDVPTNYLNRLKNFALDEYSTSEIYQSHPTVVLELSRTIIELVPSIKNSYNNYQIPSPTNNYYTWLTIHPNSFNSEVSNKNANENNLIYPLIRLMKYWNARNNYVYSSFELENLIVGQYYVSCQTLWDYLRSFVNLLSYIHLDSWKADKVKSLKQICKFAMNLDSGGLSYDAQIEIKKAFPAY